MTVSTYTWMSAPDVSSAAAFRKWVQGIHDAFVACGWVQTADTGQIADISTLAVPAINTAAGYRMYRLDDALQATAPIYIKFEPGVGSSSTRPTLWFTIGRTTNGAGTLSNLLLARTQTNYNSPGITTEVASYASGDGSSLCLALWPAHGGSTQPVVHLVIERSRDQGGAPTGDAWLISAGWDTASSLHRVIGTNGVIDASEVAEMTYLAVLPGKINGVSQSVASTLSRDGVTAPVLPIACIAPGVTPWVSNVIVAVHPGDAGSTSVIQAATINGATRTYRAWTNFDATAGSIIAATLKIRPAIAWAV